MIPKNANWYKEIWTLDIKEQSWTEETIKQVDFLIEVLGLKGNERILDGVDITEAYVEDARRQAKKEKLSAEFLHMDIRDVKYKEEFDVVLNMADGAIGWI